MQEGYRIIKFNARGQESYMQRMVNAWCATEVAVDARGMLPHTDMNVAAHAHTETTFQTLCALQPGAANY